MVIAAGPSGGTAAESTAGFSPDMPRHVSAGTQPMKNAELFSY